jgi:hypothetical protein
MPLGSLLGGTLGDAYGADVVMMAGGLGLLWIVIYILLIPALRTLPAPIEVETLARPDARDGAGGLDSSDAAGAD